MGADFISEKNHLNFLVPSRLSPSKLKMPATLATAATTSMADGRIVPVTKMLFQMEGIVVGIIELKFDPTVIFLSGKEDQQRADETKTSRRI